MLNGPYTDLLYIMEDNQNIWSFTQIHVIPMQDFIFFAEHKRR